MSTIKLDASGDVEILNGKISLLNVDGSELLEETAQRLKLKLTTFLGTWFLDPRVGMPYYENVFIKNPRLSVLEAMFTEAIVSDEQVDFLNSLDLDFDNSTRKLSVVFQAVLLDGQVLDFADFILGDEL